jgi:hypothetical protein
MRPRSGYGFIAVAVVGVFAGLALGRREAVGQFNADIQVIQVFSGFGGAESIAREQTGTVRRHGGTDNNESVITRDIRSAGQIRAFFAGVEVFNICGTTSNLDGSVDRCWIIPTQSKGRSGSFSISDAFASAEDHLFILGSNSCVNACGQMSTECWCETVCFTLGDCCPDKFVECGG